MNIKLERVVSFKAGTRAGMAFGVFFSLCKYLWDFFSIIGLYTYTHFFRVRLWKFMLIKCKKKQTNRTASKSRILKGVRKRSMVYSTGGTLALLIQNAIFYCLIIAVYNGFHRRFSNISLKRRFLTEP